jgi:hypothetical protein
LIMTVVDRRLGVAPADRSPAHEDDAAAVRA